MELSFKQNLDDALAHWRAFWNKDILKRPCVSVCANKENAKPAPWPPGQFLPDADFDDILARAEEAMAQVYYGGEAMPIYTPSFGPDQIAAFVGGTLNTSPSSDGTTWSVPFVELWETALPLRLGARNNAWARMQEMYRKAGQRGRGKFVIGMPDLHSNFDLLAAIRGPDRVCMDLLDVPGLIRRAMTDARAIYKEVYHRLWEAAGMDRCGTGGWLPYYCETRYVTTQCDFCLLLSPAQFNEYVLPALTEESDSVDHSVYHYDGRGALVHFDAITGIRKLDGIQWTISAGDAKASMLDWIDLLQRFQAAGKNVFIGCSPDELKIFHRQLKPNLVYYQTWANSPKEADELLRWLERNT